MLDRLVGWLGSGSEADLVEMRVSPPDDRGVDRLFRQLVPDVMGRRSGHEIMDRLTGKWHLSHLLSHNLGGFAKSSTPCPACAAPPTKFCHGSIKSSPRSRLFRSLRWLSSSTSSLFAGWKRHASSSTWVSAGESVSIPR